MTAPERTREELMTLAEIDALDASLTALGAWEINPHVEVSPLAWPTVRRLLRAARQGVEANEDAERLDWLEERVCETAWPIEKDYQGWGAWGHFGHRFPTLRAAIDAARAARRPEEQEGE